MLVKTKAQRIRKYLREHGGKDVVIIDLKGESNIADFLSMMNGPALENGHMSNMGVLQPKCMIRFLNCSCG